MKTAVMVFAAAASVLAPVADAKQARGNGSARFLVEMEDGGGFCRKVGETVTVKASVKDKDGAAVNSGTVEAWADDGWTNVVWRRSVDLAKEPVVKMKLSRATPGTLRIHLGMPGVREKMDRVVFGVGEIMPLTPYPEDFESYWRGELDKLKREVPIAVEKTPAPDLSTAEHDMFRVSFSTFNGKRVYGFLAVPKGKGPFPVCVNVPGAGPGVVAPSGRTVRKDWITFTMNMHCFPIGRTKLEQRERYDAWLADLQARGGEPKYQRFGFAAGRDKPIYHDVMLGMVRALDWLADEPYADASRFVYFGCSQGGGFGICLTSLWGRFAKSLILCPNLCDMLAYRAGRQPGSEHIMMQTPEHQPSAELVAPYYDACNFARLVRSPVRMVYGLSDDNCNTGGGIAAFNAIGAADKELRLLPGLGHGWHTDGFDAWLFDLPAWSGPFEDRWVYVSRNLSKPEHVQEVADIVKTAKSVDLNGMLFACGVEHWHKWPADRKARLAEIKRVCDAEGVEIIPIIWSVGYGGYDPAYAAALPCTNMPFVAKGGKAVFAGGGVGEFANPGFDEPPKRPNAAPGWAWTDKPGKVSFIDTDVKASGTASLRIENYGDNPHGHGRACHQLKVTPGGRYRVSCMMKTDGVEPTSGVLLQVYGMDGASVVGKQVKLAATQDWTRVECIFNAAGRSEFRVYAGIWGGKAGRLWLDDFKVEDMGCAPPLLREGVTFDVRDVRTGAKLRAGVDYELPPQTAWNRKWNSFRILPGGAVREGAELVVDYWTAAVVASGQRPCCMSTPALYDYYRTSAAAVKEALNPRKWFLSMDEIRAGGTCPLCQARGLDMAHQLGECLARQREIIKAVRPDAQIYVWSDMLDPAHNAHDNYYACKGTFEGSWDLIPKDLVISCWYGKKRDISMPFFAQRGFRTQAAAYYDADALDGCRAWLETCKRTPGCTGIMYTSWRNKYKLLAPFGELVRKGSE